MADAAKAEAAKDGVDLAITSDKVAGSDEVQSSAIETAVASGVSTILITPAGPGVVPAIRKARASGVMVLALDNSTTPNDAVDMAYVTSNKDAGQALGKYVAAKLAGAPAIIAMLDVFEGKIVQVDIDRDHGFLTGMGIAETNPNINGTEPKTGKYVGGGTYTVVCHQATQRRRTAAGQQWKIAFPKIRISTSSTPSTSPLPSAHTRRSTRPERRKASPSPPSMAAVAAWPP